ncbi:MAG: T9SS type A sorting domain-containing protein [Candidatus Marinimicrobia bacterium]|nr:T9SS type A sorting domain-containing protein [Candidatus Neomarinimicrobiota bacterium]
MRKSLLLSLVFVIFLFGTAFSGWEKLINEFDQAPEDTNYWAWFDQINVSTSHGAHYQANDNADSTRAYIHISYVNDIKKFGDGAMKLVWATHNTESWGGYTKIEHWNPDSDAVYDWSSYDTVSFWYYNVEPQNLEGRVHLRFNLHDVSNSPNGNKTYSVNDCEYYYSFHYVLDNEPGWNEIKIPLIASGEYWSGEGFNLTGWAGIPGNGVLDKDKIKGFSIEFSMSGSGEGDSAKGAIILDHLVLKGPRSIAVVFFNGKAVPNNVTMSSAWGNTGAYMVTNEEDVDNGLTNSIKWKLPTQAWDGLMFTMDSPRDLGYTWTVDSIKFWIKAPSGIGQLKLVLTDDDIDGWVDNDGNGADDTPDLEFEAGYTITEDMGYFDGTWKLVKVALKDFYRLSGAWDGAALRAGEMDSTRFYRFKILVTDQTTGYGEIVYLDNVWIGNPLIDNIAPAAVQNVSTTAGEYYNLVTWQDVPGENGEVYNVYASESPITDINDPTLEVVASGVLENVQTAIHWLCSPLKDEDVTYYYAVVCIDGAGNVGEPGFSDAFTNTAKGIPVISMNPPQNFVADGDFSEWEGIKPFIINPELGHVPAGTVDDANDLNATVYLAMDSNYLYIGADVVDDVYNYDPNTDWWNSDAFQVFIGLYDWVGAKHTSFMRGSEPDYSLYMNETGFHHDTRGGVILYEPGTDNYFFEGYNPDYVIEAKIPLDSIKMEEDARFYPEHGMRIPIDLYFHDNDGSWEGNVGFSKFSTDNQWRYPTEWAYTWVFDTTKTDIKAAENAMSFVYKLYDNYPNPFNPNTTIAFSIANYGKVELIIYDVLGREVDKVINKDLPAGYYKVNWNAKDYPSGIYIYQLRAGDFIMTKKMLLIK